MSEAPCPPQPPLSAAHPQEHQEEGEEMLAGLEVTLELLSAFGARQLKALAIGRSSGSAQVLHQPRQAKHIIHSLLLPQCRPAPANLLHQCPPGMQHKGGVEVEDLHTHPLQGHYHWEGKSTSERVGPQAHT